MPCTCAGTAPGYPQHESGCGQPEPDDTDDEYTDDDAPCPYGVCSGGYDQDGHTRCLEEGRMQARDHDAWSRLWRPCTAACAADGIDACTAPTGPRMRSGSGTRKHARGTSQRTSSLTTSPSSANDSS